MLDAKLYSRLYKRSIIIKIVVFIIAFSVLFWYIRVNQGLSDYHLEQDLRSIPYLFSAGNLIFSIISGSIFWIQWGKWDRLNDVNHGEINMLRQLYILAHHFPRDEMNDIRFRIYYYVKTYIEASDGKSLRLLETRSQNVDDALVKIEDSMFGVSKKHPDVGPMAFGFLTRAMEYREQKIHLSNQQLPLGVRVFVMFATFSVIFGSLFVPFNSILYNYYFTLVDALLAFGVFLIIEDFDHPYRPGNFVLNVNLYKILMEEIRTKLEQRGFDIEAAEAKETKTAS